MARRAISIAVPTAIPVTLATGRPRRLTPAAIQTRARPHGLRPSALALAAFATASLAAGGALLPARSAQAQTAATATQATAPATRHYHLPAGPLGASLAAFAGQAGLLLSFDPALTQGRQAPALQGQHSPQSGLAALLAGSGLQAVQQADGSFTLRRAPAPARAADASVQTLPAVTVQAAPETATGPVPGYAARRSATATKTDTPLLETPQSISVVGAEEIEDRGASNLMEIGRYTAGVQVESYGNGAHYNWISLRGFNANASTYVNGLRAPSSGYVSRLTNPFEVERFEALRGPSSALYGLGDAGGVINVITKQAGPEAERQVQAELGSHRKALGVDVGGALDAQRSLHWRVVAAANHNRHFFAIPGHGRQTYRSHVLAPSLSWTPNADTTLTLHGRWFRKQGADQETQFLGADRQSSSGWSNSNPSFSFGNTRQGEWGYQFSHRLHAGWSIQQRFVSGSHRFHGGWLYGEGPADPQTGELAQTAYENDNRMRHTALDTQLQGQWHSGRVRHTLALGLDAHASRFASVNRDDPAESLNIFLPPEAQYRRPVPPPTTVNTDEQTRQRQIGLYLQDQMQHGPWRLTLGGRYDRVHTRLDNRLDGSQTREKDGAFSGRVALGHVWPSGWAPYLSYATSFLPESGADAHGALFKPTRGQQWELGLKWQPSGRELLLTAAVFDLRKTNVPTNDPEHYGHRRQTGEVRSRGLELEAKGALTRQLKLTAQLTVQDVKIARSEDGDQGNRVDNVPRMLASAWLDYRLAAAPGLSAGLGVRHTGSRYAYSDNQIAMPAHTLLDAALRYERGPWQAALNVSNLSNKRYASSYGWGYYPGLPRTVTASLKYRF
ncbi:TonB-dependent siderophore receptor [Vandammella animalimorsus]|uniref:TonB-dependent siderophore receptor n=1 Tax=Vandammella animalimorsus TaxID=2029117 RepID=A0A2A2ADJ8_9BURK|nr:TonB-dependent siderophore receptor [Vandammella animalimorsus]PAT35669.1 TonB-dependent siderophore receptor [Vandammella animalimorsus]